MTLEIFQGGLTPIKPITKSETRKRNAPKQAHSLVQVQTFLTISTWANALHAIVLSNIMSDEGARMFLKGYYK